MNLKKLMLIVAGVSGIDLYQGTLVAQDMASGKDIYKRCASCHGDSGEGVAAFNAPALAGQSEQYLNLQLKNFKSGIRGSHPEDKLGAQMQAMAATLTNKTIINEVTSYIASLPATYPVQKVQGSLRRGSNLYQGNCGACHNPKGEGNPMLNAPRLAGLDSVYMSNQIKHFQNGLRGSDPADRYGKQMQVMANTIKSESDLQDIMAYLHSFAK